jgi:hypothetical protein
MMVNGLTTKDKVTVESNGLMEHHLKANMLMARRMDMVHLDGLIAQATRETSETTTLMAKATISGQMEELSKEIGKITKWTAMVSSLGKMEEDMKVNILMIRNTVMASSTGQMEEFMMANGHLASKKASVHIQQLARKRNMENGKLERESDGWKRKN